MVACEHTHKYGAWSVWDAMSESILRVGMKRCNGCRWLSVDCFATNPTTEALYSKCRDCKLKPNASGHAKRDADLKKQKAALEAGETPETLICQRCGPQPFSAFGCVCVCVCKGLACVGSNRCESARRRRNERSWRKRRWCQRWKRWKRWWGHRRRRTWKAYDQRLRYWVHDYSRSGGRFRAN